MQRNWVSSISREIESVGKTAGKRIDDVLDVIKNAPAGSLTNDAEVLFKKLPASSFAKEGEFITTKTGKDLSVWSRDFRAGTDQFDNSLRDIGIDPASFDSTALKNMNFSSFTDGDIAIIDNTRLADKVAIGGDATRQLDNLSARDIDQLAAAPENNNAISSLWTKAKKVGTITLTTGAVVAVGFVASEFIKDAIALNSGCFLTIKSDGKANWRRVIGYTCGDAYGDQLWLSKKLPTSNHPLAQYIKTNQCDGITGCDTYCNTEKFDSALASHIAEIPATQTLVCKVATISDILSDVSKDLGTSLGNIAGGVTGGVVGGISNSLGINLSFLWIIVGIVILVIIGIVLFKIVGKPRAQTQ